MWILIHEHGVKYKVCSIYCAAKVNDRNFENWNFELYSRVKPELDTIQADGYLCVLRGDLNGHVGADARGIPNNHDSINLNGGLIRDFVDAKSR